MHLCTAAGFERDVEDFLMSRFHDRRAVLAWMQNIYDPDQMICALEEKPDRNRKPVLLGVVQILFRNGIFHGQSVLCAWIDNVLTVFDDKEPESEPLRRDVFSKLLNAALQKAQSNALLVFGFDEVSAQGRFCRIGTLMEAGLAQPDQPVCPWKVLRHDGRMDLYPVYRKFLEAFECCIVLDSRQLEDRLRVWKHQGRIIIVCYDQNFAPCAFCTLESRRDQIVLDHFVYDSPDALEALLFWAFERYSKVVIRYSGAENFASIAAIDKPQQKAAVYCRADLELVSAFLRRPVASCEELFSLQTRPGWHNLH